jgi:hypothetical protein
MKTAIEITCQCQRDIKVSIEWCDLNQYQQLCAGCDHNEGRKRSKYQQRQRIGRKETR